MRAPFFPSSSSAFRVAFSLLLASGALSPAAFSATSQTAIPSQALPTYTIVAKTYDPIRAWVYDPTIRGVSKGKVFQGSFGAPSINDKGTVAYACGLAGHGITSDRSYSAVIRLKGNHPPVVAIQALELVDKFVEDAYGEGAVPNGSFIEPDSCWIKKIGQNVAVNNANKLAFTAEVGFWYETYTNSGIKFTESETGATGVILPLNAKVRSFRNRALVSYPAFDSSVMYQPLSLNSSTATGWNIGGEFGYSSPNAFEQSIADTNVSVVGLPYFTNFASFTTAMLTNGNVAFVTASLQNSNFSGVGLYDGIWAGSDPNLQPVAVVTSASPDGKSGTFQSFGDVAGPSRNGLYCAFMASTNLGTSGVFRTNVDGSNKIMITKIGATAPTSPEIGNLGQFTSFELVGCNDFGQVVILGSLNTATPTGAAKRGIWVSDKTGANLRLVAVEGQTYAGVSTTRSVTRLTFSPVSCINRSGQIAFTASFDDRTSAVIVANF